MTPFKLTSIVLTVSTAGLLAACGSMAPMAPTFSQASLPATVQVPSGNKVAMETQAEGKILYECRAKATAAGQFEWAFVGPDARLMSRNGMSAGKYYGPPATWESNDGSKVTAVQVAVAPGTPGAIPLQLVKGNPAVGAGGMQGVTYIQRVNTKGGIAPATPCVAGKVGEKQMVPYTADYIFYKAA
ncbi:MAG: DUF3455 domain-containing protein [Janthinobacterium lividum]